MSLSLDRMRFRTRQGLGKLDDDTLTDIDVDELLNMALWDLENKFDFEARKTSLTAALVSGQFEYSISPSDLGITLNTIKSVSLLDTNGIRRRLERTTRTWINDNFEEGWTGLPTKYVREGSVLTVYPVPSDLEDGVELTINVIEGVEDLAEGSNEETGLPKNWDELVIQGAIWRGNYFVGQTDKALTQSNFQRGKVLETRKDREKEDDDSHSGGLDVRWE